MADKKPTKKEANEALKVLNGVRDDAQRELDALDSIKQFAMVGECEDKNGELTRVLILDTDADGILGLFMELGQPYSFVTDVDVPADERIKKNGAKFQRYFQEMVNIDLTDKANLRAIGWGALGQAREYVDGFFMLRLVCDTQLELSTES